MIKDEKRVIQKTVEKIIANCQATTIPMFCGENSLPNRDVIIDIIKEIRMALFPGYFDVEISNQAIPEYVIGNHLTNIFDKLKGQIKLALLNKYSQCLDKDKIESESFNICNEFFKRIPEIQTLLFKDISAAFDGDPAAQSKEEIVFSYPGFFAILVYRLAHELYHRNVPYIPRIMTEYAHSGTGIDINAGAKIGEYFFIDHGTGVVIGETAIIGNRVKLYQGVTLGALSTREGQKMAGKKRHPTVEDNVTIYSGATILGGATIIGENSVIGGNAFIIESIPKNTKVSIKTPELNIRLDKKTT